MGWLHWRFPWSQQIDSIILHLFDPYISQGWEIQRWTGLRHSERSWWEIWHRVKFHHLVLPELNYADDNILSIWKSLFLVDRSHKNQPFLPHHIPFGHVPNGHHISGLVLKSPTLQVKPAPRRDGTERMWEDDHCLLFLKRIADCGRCGEYLRPCLAY